MEEHPLDLEQVAAPHPALSALGAVLDALLEDMPRKKRAKFKRRIEENLDWLVASGQLVRLRGPKLDRSAARAHAEALGWFRRVTAAFLERPNI